MNFTFETQGTVTFLAYKVTPEDTIDTMSLGMLANNKIPGLAATIFTQMDAARFIKFNVSARVSASQIFSGVVNRKRLIGVFSGITDAMLSAEEYMIDPGTILLQLDYMFVDVSSCDTILICLPVLRKENENPDLGAFFKGIMFSTQFDQTENCDYVAKIINYLNSAPTFSLPDFKQLLDGLKGAAPAPRPQPQVSAPAAQPQVTMPTPQPQVSAPVQQQAQPAVVAPAQSQPAYYPSQSVPAPAQPVSAPEKAFKKQAAPKQQFQVPQAANMGGTAPQPQTEMQGERISLFYLMQHYNKENAAKYKAQKEAKKNGTAPVVAAPTEKPKKEKKDKKKDTAQSSFAVPCALQTSFAIPGQPAPVPSAPAAPISMPAAPAKPASAPTPAAPQPQPTPVYQAQQMPQMQPQTRPMNFGETTVLGGGAGAIGETTVLGAASQKVQVMPHLIRCKNNERIELNKPVFRIGKERSYVDYFIGDNTAVSRSHANIISRDGEYFVVDTNSTNHTYVNGGMIMSNSETRLSHGAKIRLANEEFEFRLY